ncbi:MAG: 16S rRNA (guanine(966)-N(2))-methyltransferase RsmD [Chloroflexi bacterium]|jgi:16S rRNA (guanine966-N2)-methyltransferase|nr:16S rRNA (guanine(966)-N(2))-methyltransferase RsmD [Chloroflexota bacterium]MBT3669401.1 16S rRNA (guanine(966)-N(2))-methyltransferase RsmD [Chloroflexota bacterium]MBT4003295.1 16S rRNA (guanine(966)-N(2))-methyltransferase RsmD [Chloroflexota bacterium]MBT4304580.1 16S rRNA (guanine(966)-N(2))-methyltransferase RsmD [Chloroflexota bacterium]MBT4534079.1 16S rRNA (guanine(966)-N(2))-methyltransferase RsmD [Chloroflexota bacterium]
MARIRVIAGEARGVKLAAVPGDITRPITDRVKESLFNILHQDMPDCSFFDLFAGTGSIGIEALSRGSRFARFNDIHRSAINTIKRNLEVTKLQDRAEVLQMDAFTLLSKDPDHNFDYLYIAPPQYKELWNKTLAILDINPNWLVEDGWVIVQIDPKEYGEVEMNNFSLFDQRKYGRTLLLFYERVG